MAWTHDVPHRGYQRSVGLEPAMKAHDRAAKLNIAHVNRVEVELALCNLHKGTVMVAAPR